MAGDPLLIHIYYKLIWINIIVRMNIKSAFHFHIPKYEKLKFDVLFFEIKRLQIFDLFLVDAATTRC